MTVATVLILVAVFALVALLALAPSAPAQRNPFPGRRRRGEHRRPAARSRSGLPHQRGFRHHAR
ncbi:hypothetical protein AB0469_33475 [Streptomyces sp. NPDC093801]|uniref:hypothetical protein n=1 Tax=Streptomyces sp. NPDC093801 TaxID=3155203 RepID=UPI00344F8CCA